MMKRYCFYKALLIAGLCVQDLMLRTIVVQAQPEQTYYKELRILSTSALYCGEAGREANKMQTRIPAGTRLIEVQRINRYWVRVAQTDPLRALLAARRGSQEVECAEQDWYFYDYNPQKPPDDFDSQPQYALARWFDQAQVEKDHMFLLFRSDLDTSLIGSLVSDLEENRITPIEVEILSGPHVIAQGVLPSVSVRRQALEIRVPALEARLAEQGKRLTIRWDEQAGFVGNNQYFVDNPVFVERRSVVPDEPEVSPTELAGEPVAYGWYLLAVLGGGVLGASGWYYSYKWHAQTSAVVGTLEHIDTALGLVPARPPAKAIDASTVLARNEQRDAQLSKINALLVHLMEVDLLLEGLGIGRTRPEGKQEREQWLLSEDAAAMRTAVVHLINLLPKMDALLYDLERYDSHFGIPLSQSSERRDRLHKMLDNQDRRARVLEAHEAQATANTDALTQLMLCVDQLIEVDELLGLAEGVLAGEGELQQAQAAANRHGQRRQRLAELQERSKKVPTSGTKPPSIP